MCRIKKGALFLLVLSGFTLITLLGNFFHTERHLDQKSPCPICQMQKSAVAAGLALAVILPRLLLVGLLVSRDSPLRGFSIFFERVSRAPPVCS
jgi:disulfide bond formation protein DsbB